LLGCCIFYNAWFQAEAARFLRAADIL